MRKKIKLFCYVAIVFLVAMFFSYKTSAMEVTTEVKGKLDSCDLSKFGGSAVLVETGDENWIGGGGAWISGGGFNEWWRGPITYTIEYKADWFFDGPDKISGAFLKIYDSKGRECTAKLPLEPAKYEQAIFEVTFEGKTVWKNIQACVMSTGNGYYTCSAADEIMLDAEDPVLKDGTIDVKIENGELKINTIVKDQYSGVDNSSVVLYVDKEDGSFSDYSTDTKSLTGGDCTTKTCTQVTYSSKFPEENYGILVIRVEAADKVGNSLNKKFAFNPYNGAIIPFDSLTNEENQENSSGSENEYVPKEDDDPLDSDFGASIDENYELQCDSDIVDFINKLWNMVLVAGPVLMLVMSTIEFVKPLLASDSDALSKAGSNTVKRAIAFVCLLLLKVILTTILNLFSIQICW